MSLQYGDTSGDLLGQKGDDQTLIGIAGESNDLYGDAGGWLRDDATGGDDTLNGGANSPMNILIGDGLYMFNSTGGDDALTGEVNSNNRLYGDAGANVRFDGRRRHPCGRSRQRQSAVGRGRFYVLIHGW